VPFLVVYQRIRSKEGLVVWRLWSPLASGEWTTDGLKILMPDPSDLLEDARELRQAEAPDHRVGARDPCPHVGWTACAGSRFEQHVYTA
jgi:hypothetical protein